MTFPKTALTYRLAAPADKAELIKMRVSCGWGEKKVPDDLIKSQEGEIKLYLFELDEKPVGMGSIDLKDQDKDLVNLSTHTVMISRLFVYNQYQGQNLGNQIMDILERLCVCEFNAKVITVNTYPRYPDGTTSRNKLWYPRRGYVEFKDEEPRYEPDDGSSELMPACFFKKVVG